MANWCLTYITINSEDKQGLQNLYNVIEKSMESNYKKNCFGLGWLGNIVGNTGIGTVDEGKETDLCCRGSLDYLELQDESLLIHTETAWMPMLNMWIKLVDKYLPGAEIIYSAEECSCALYYTNDPEYIDKWLIDTSLYYLEYDRTATDHAVAVAIKSILEKSEDSELLEVINNYLDGTSDMTIDSIVDKFNQIDDSDTFIRRWEYYNPEDLD